MNDSNQRVQPAPSPVRAAATTAGTLRIGLVGTGFLAATRARCWAQVPGAVVAGVAGRDTAESKQRAAEFARTHGIEGGARTLAELLADPEIGLIDLCVPNLEHLPLTRAAAEAGKHVLCTKPLTAYHGQDLEPGAPDEAIAARDPRDKYRVAVADAEALVRAADAAGVRFFYGENWVYAPAVRRAAELLVASGGALLEMRGWECHKGSHSPYAKRWKHAGGGALLRLGAHPVGAMLYLKRLEGQQRLGRPIRPVHVSAEVADLSQVEGLRPETTAVATGWVDVESWGCAVIAFDDGSRGVAYGSDNVLGGMQSKLELYGSNHVLECNLSPNDLLRGYAPGPEVFGDEYIMEKTDTAAGWSTPMPDEDWTSGQMPMCAAVAAALRDGRPAESDGVLGVETTRVLYGAYVSAAEGRRFALDEDPVG